jgi:hypothetical protein
MGVDLLPRTDATVVAPVVRLDGDGVRSEQCTQGTGVERSRDAERPGERRSALRAVEAVRVGVQPRTTSGQPVPWVGIDDPVRGHHPQEFRRRGP